MDDRSFDNLVRDLAASRRSFALATVGLALSLASRLPDDTEAARRRQGGRRKTRKPGHGKQGASGKGPAAGQKPHDGRDGDCEGPDSCPRDPESGRPGFRCPDGLCSCGGTCCAKGFACFVEESFPGREICCFVDGDQSPPPTDANYVVCPGDKRDPNVCCESDHCQVDGTCPTLTLGRYRRNPR